MPPNTTKKKDVILVVDDEENVLRGYDVALRMEGFTHVVCCRNGEEALSTCQQVGPSVVILDLLMPGLPGKTVLERLISLYPQVPVIVATGMNDVALAVACIKAGAFDYVVKPVGRERIATLVRRAIEFASLRNENETLRLEILSGRLRNPEAFAHIITANPDMIAAMRYVEAIAKTDAPVLITGETGTGKELFARSLHALSGRTGQFVCVNVAGLDDQLFSDALFGHRKGAFTGAIDDRAGLTRKAQGGTLFLDEIGDLSPASQVKLLRLVEAREYSPLGSDEILSTDALMVVATNRDLETMRESGRFRHDLFYRLRQHHVHIPPLRNRLVTDLSLLVDHFVSKAAERLRVPRPQVPRELTAILANYHFPGNVRELEAILFDAVSRNQQGGVLPLASIREYIKNQAVAAQLPPPSATEIQFPQQLPTLKQVEDALVKEALRRAGGNQRTAAMLLGITQQAVSYRLRALNKNAEAERSKRI